MPATSTNQQDNAMPCGPDSDIGYFQRSDSRPTRVHIQLSVPVELPPEFQKYHAAVIQDIQAAAVDAIRVFEARHLYGDSAYHVRLEAANAD